jgi:hypothetical protein
MTKNSDIAIGQRLIICYLMKKLNNANIITATRPVWAPVATRKGYTPKNYNVTFMHQHNHIRLNFTRTQIKEFPRGQCDVNEMINNVARLCQNEQFVTQGESA